MKRKTAIPAWLAALMVITVIFVGGCGIIEITGDNPDNPGQTGQADNDAQETTNISIPLIVVVNDTPGDNGSSSGQSKALMANWDPRACTFQVDDKILYSFDRSIMPPRIGWDGGRQIFACHIYAEDADNFQPGNSPAVDITVIDANLKTWPVLIEASSDDCSLLVAYPAASGGPDSPDTGIMLEETKNGKTANKTINPPPWKCGPKLCPYLISGTIDKCRLLLFYNDAEDASDGIGPIKMALGKVSGTDVVWTKIPDEGGPYIAGAGSSMSFIGDNIYSSNPVTTFDTASGDPVWVKYQPIADLLNRIKTNIAIASADVEGDIMGGQPSMGAFDDYMLACVWLPDEIFVWALYQDKCIGELHIDKLNNKAYLNNGDGQSNTNVLDLDYNLNYLIIPHDGYGNDQ